MDGKASRMKGRGGIKKMEKRSQNRPSCTKKSVARRGAEERKHELAEQNRGSQVGSIRARCSLGREGPYETKQVVIYRITVPDGKNTVQVDLSGDGCARLASSGVVRFLSHLGCPMAFSCPQNRIGYRIEDRLLCEISVDTQWLWCLISSFLTP